MDNSDPSNVTKALKLSKRLLKMFETIMESDEHDGFRTPTPFNEFEVLEGTK
jgi:hypothetical protein